MMIWTAYDAGRFDTSLITCVPDNLCDRALGDSGYAPDGGRAADGGVFGEDEPLNHQLSARAHSL